MRAAPVPYLASARHRLIQQVALAGRRGLFLTFVLPAQVVQPQRNIEMLWLH